MSCVLKGYIAVMVSGRFVNAFVARLNIQYVEKFRKNLMWGNRIITHVHPGTHQTLAEVRRIAEGNYCV